MAIPLQNFVLLFDSDFSHNDCFLQFAQTSKATELSRVRWSGHSGLHSERAVLLWVSLIESNESRWKRFPNDTVCPDCNHFTEDSCERHPFHNIPDNPSGIRGSADYHIASIPPQLCLAYSSIPNAGKGVFAQEFLPKLTKFGPYIVSQSFDEPNIWVGICIFRQGEETIIDSNSSDFLEGHDDTYSWEVRKIIKFAN